MFFVNTSLRFYVLFSNMAVLRSCFCALAAAALLAAADDGDWPAYGNDPGGQRYSPLKAINLDNVAGLKPAWTFRTGDAYWPKDKAPTRFQATPIYVDGKLYVSTPLGRIIALDPVTGRQLWVFDSKTPRDGGYGDFGNRGLATWASPSGERRLFLATIDARLIAVAAGTGTVCKEFGDNGTINLRNGLRLPPLAFGDYEETSPPAIVGNTVVIGSAIADNAATNQASGEVRGFDATTGKLKWSWDPITHNKNEKSWGKGSAAKTGGANAWSPIAADPARGLVFIPTGSPSPDYFGGERPGDNAFANSIVALRAETGEHVWHFQTIHHDLWDYDVAAPPLLFDIERGGRTVPAIAVGSKSASLFILHRETGEPLFPVKEQPVPASDVPGETAWTTQPVSVLPAPVSRQSMAAAEAWGIDDVDRQWCRNAIGQLRNEGVFTPPSTRGTLVFPGFVGGMAWSGAAYDNSNRLLILPANNLAVEVHLIPRNDFESEYNTRQRKLNGDWEFARQSGTPFGMRRRVLLSPKGIPCTAPPWGTLQAISMETGKKVWDVPLGQLNSKLPEELGSVALGGPIVTASGLVFAAGTLDPHMRAFDVKSGKQLWKGQLPTSARSTPMTFRGPDGKQYLVICAGGHQPAGDQPLGDYVVAFSL